MENKEVTAKNLLHKNELSSSNHSRVIDIQSFLWVKFLTLYFSVGFAPSAVKMEHNEAADVDYLRKKLQPFSSCYKDINDLR